MTSLFPPCYHIALFNVTYCYAEQQKPFSKGSKMKDVKFVILLFLIVVIALISVIWLAVLQAKYNTLSSLKAGLNPKVQSLTIVDEQGRDRIQLTTWENKAAIDILDYEEQIIVRLFAYIFGENEDSEAGLQIEQLPWDKGASAKGITITTTSFGFPEIQLINLYGEGTKIQANKMKNFPLGTW